MEIKLVDHNYPFTTAEPGASGSVDVSAGSHPLSAPVEVTKSTSNKSEHQGIANFILRYRMQSADED